MKFKQLADMVITNHYQYKKSPMNIIIVNELISLIGDVNIKQINATTYDELLKHWRGIENGNSTINRKLLVLGFCMTYAYERELIPTRPKFKLLTETPEELSFVSPLQETALLEYFTVTDEDKLKLSEEKLMIKTLMKAIIIIGLDTGARMSELLRIDADHIDNNYIRLYITKNDKPRSIPMTKRVKEQIEIIKQYDYFANLNKSKVSYQFNDTAVKNLGFYDITFHSLRHTFCSRLLQAGVPIYKVSKLMGHKDVTITDRIYGHLVNKDLEEAIALLEKTYN